GTRGERVRRPDAVLRLAARRRGDRAPGRGRTPRERGSGRRAPARRARGRDSQGGRGDGSRGGPGAGGAVRISDAGGRILVNPADLRRGAQRLRELSGELKVATGRLQRAPVPETAPPADGVPDAVHALGARLDVLVQPLVDSAVELDRRAFWADIADQLAAGYPLTG